MCRVRNDVFILFFIQTTAYHTSHSIKEMLHEMKRIKYIYWQEFMRMYEKYIEPMPT